MTEKGFEQEMCFYQRTILEAVARVDPRFSWKEEAPEVVACFDTLIQDDLTHFRRVCARLLEDERREIRLGTLSLLGSCRLKKDHELSVVLAQIALKQKDVREEALVALWHVRTRRVLPQLLWFAEKGYSSALYMVRPMLQTPEEIERGIALARKYIDANDYPLREAALFLLQKHSTREREAEQVLAAVQKYMDELFIDALKEAPPEKVLESLKALRSTLAENFAEYGDLSSTIEVLEQKNKADESYS
jgi:hypothetical protein